MEPHRPEPDPRPPSTFAQRVLARVVFAVLMTLSIVGSFFVVVLLYLPFVALKAIWLAARGKVALKSLRDEPQTRRA